MDRIVKKNLILCAVVLCLLAVVSYPSEKQRGTTGAQFLKIGLGARPVAMGGAFAGVSNDVNALYWNPAGLGQLSKTELILQHIVWFQNIGYQWFGMVHKFENIGTVGLSISYLSVGQDIEARTGPTDKPDYKFGASDMAVGLAYGKSLGKVLLGLNLKFIQQKIDARVDKNTATGFAADIGGLFKFGKIDAGLVIQNVGTEIKFDKKGDRLPTNIRLGIGSNRIVENLTLGLDINVPVDNNINAALGAEYVVRVSKDISLPIRLGYKTANDFGFIDGLSAGFGAGFRNFNLDLSWVPYGDLGQTYRASLTIKFGR